MILCLLISCTGEFESLNTNPNAPIKVQPSLLLRQVIYDFGEEMAYEGFVAGNLLSQHFTMVDFNLFDRHRLTDPQLGGNPWPSIYTNLRDNELIINESQSNPTFNVYEGPSLILKAYMFAVLTDLYGDVPYLEALQGLSGNSTPSYDSQESIYMGPDGILANLDKGINAIKNNVSNTKLDGDILFDGDLKSWIRFGNSLKIKYLMRISDRINVSSDLQRIYDEGLFIRSNDQNAKFDFTNERPNSFRMQQLRDGDFNLFVMSETIEEILNQYEDPRINILFQPRGNSASGILYKGLLNGPDASKSSISISDYSLAGTIFRQHTADLDANFMTAWETHLFLAEAVTKELVKADPKGLYDLGVRQAFEYWQTIIPGSYLSAGKTSFGGSQANKLEQIITQKWIANSINGYEGWIEYRRTGYPKLKTLSASLNNNLIPVRMPYPTDEAALNQLNFAAATVGNANSINFKVWWDLN